MPRSNHELKSALRFQRGMTAIAPARPLYGWTVKCSCGWEKRYNGPKREALAYHKDHREDQERDFYVTVVWTEVHRVPVRARSREEAMEMVDSGNVLWSDAPIDDAASTWKVKRADEGVWRAKTYGTPVNLIDVEMTDAAS